MLQDKLVTRRTPELDPDVRGDEITGDRYFSRDWMSAEWNRVWKRVWHIGGLVTDIPEAGDYVVHNFANESVVMIRQEDASVKAFFNACRHRGNRLTSLEIGSANALTCTYHGWRWAMDGSLTKVQDPNDFRQGNPCGKLKLIEIACDIWGPFVWFNMDKSAQPVRDWLGVVADQLAAYKTEDTTRVMYLTADVDCNWKIIRDNFNEAYHIPSVHPELMSYADDDYNDTVFEMFPNEHNRMIMKGSSPSRRKSTFDSLEQLLAADLANWGLDPAEFAGSASKARLAIQQQKRKLGAERGYNYYAHLTDSQLTDYYHYTLFPNVTLTMGPDGFQILRSEPHPNDPEKCIFDHWYFMPSIQGRNEVETPIGMLPYANAERIRCKHGEQSLGFVADQDLSIAVGQQQGLHSQGYTGGYLTEQEKRVQLFHEILNDYIEGRR